MIKIFGLSRFFGKPGDSGANFGEKVEFSPNAPVKFEDFSLTYVGERRVSSDKFPRGFLYHDFKVETAGEVQTVSWSGGTGDIAPVCFVVGGKQYDLELRMSDKLGKLSENELVVWKK